MILHMLEMVIIGALSTIENIINYEVVGEESEKTLKADVVFVYFTKLLNNRTLSVSIKTSTSKLR